MTEEQKKDPEFKITKGIKLDAFAEMCGLERYKEETCKALRERVVKLITEKDEVILRRK